MVRVNEARSYHSPLREQQTRATRIQILEALIDLINDRGAHDLSIKDLAGRAGVSERTVYRHFADRRALLDGLVEHIGQTLDRLADAPVGGRCRVAETVRDRAQRRRVAGDP